MESLTAFTGSVPANYEKYLGPVLFEPYALDLVSRLKNDQLEKVLELACGTGRVTKHIAGLMKGTGRLIASDLNPGMVEMAQTIIKDSNIKWQVADAQELPFENESFDHVICQYGVMFFPDKPKAFTEAYRVLQPSGKFLFNVWDELKNNPRVFTIKKVMDEMFGAEAPVFLTRGPYSFYNKDEMRVMLMNAGFRNINIEVVEKDSAYSGPDDLIRGFVDGTPLCEFMKDKSAEVSEALRSRLREALKVQSEQYGSRVPLKAFVVEAFK